MAGKLNGQMAAKTPRGWRIDLLVDASGRAVLQAVAHHQGGDAAGHLDVLDRPAHLAPGVVERLAVVLGDQAGQLLELRLQQRLRAGTGSAPAPPGASPARRGRPSWATPTARSTSALVESTTWAWGCGRGRVDHVQQRPSRPDRPTPRRRSCGTTPVRVSPRPAAVAIARRSVLPPCCLCDAVARSALLGATASLSHRRRA